jgi:hypothetical protein
MNLGRCDVCLKVRDIKKSFDFYKKLDFIVTGGEVENGYLILKQGTFSLGLYEGHIKSNTLNFRGGDVFAISKTLKERGLTMKSDAVKEEDGSDGAVIEDPDGNVIYFNTAPGEKA